MTWQVTVVYKTATETLWLIDVVYSSTVDEKCQIPGVCRKCTTIIGCWESVSPTSVFAGTKCTYPTPGFENFSSIVRIRCNRPDWKHKPLLEKVEIQFSPLNLIHPRLTFWLQAMRFQIWQLMDIKPNHTRLVWCTKNDITRVLFICLIDWWLGYCISWSR